MFDHRSTLDSPTGAALALYHAAAHGTPRGVVLIHHGLAEHAGRYEVFAGLLAARGFHVYAHDHRGHGSTVAPDAPLRRFARRDGAAKVLADARAVQLHAEAQHPNLPVVVFGHSMGGLVALNHALRHGPRLAGLAVWNANFDIGAQERLARVALRVERALKGSDVASRIVQSATFEAWGRSIPGRRTMADWLSHDPAAVDAYIADPLCGFAPTVSMMEDVVALIFAGGSDAGLAKLPVGLPVHCLGGTADPATRYGAAVERLAGRLRHQGLRDVTLELAAGARHETLNEIEAFRRPALAGLFAWLDRIVPPPASG
ncbi:alpha/beta fold hydrolase [Mangrovicella endophytica]|uniref:alpha/beta fold hydrolase n=1 Tax=Mangrovicella endophytica TaxID=2066697 RepID=UPI000C9E3C17|nr:alpha/beta hydrolase [Mangrovicella endophytica]